MLTVDQVTDIQMGSCTFPNMCGDVTIVWDEHNKERVLEVIRKKMSEGFTFFTTKKFAFKRMTMRVKVNKRNIDTLEEIVISDEEFEKLVQGMGDSDVADLVSSNSATLAKRQGRSALTVMERANKAEDVIARDSVGIRPIMGG